MVLGAVVGGGFSAFESAGYAYNSVIRHGDDDPVLTVVHTEVSRALAAPFGHLTWTALLGGALFAASRHGSFRITATVVWTFVGIIFLHAAWDASHGWAITLTEGLVGCGWDAVWPDTKAWVGTPSSSELWVYTLIYYGLIGLNALVGTIWVVRRWRRYGADAPVSVTAVPGEVAG
jgi:hypothetical protein